MARSSRRSGGAGGWCKAAFAAAILVACSSSITVASEGLASPTPMVDGASAAPPTGAPAPEQAGWPLPDFVVTAPPDVPTVDLEPASEPSLVAGETIPYELGHCGLYSPIDLDGSLWRPVSGAGPTGDPLQSDDEIGELINATPGELTLLDEERATFVTATGSTIDLVRAPGAVAYPLCM